MKKIVLLSVMVILMCCAGMVKAQRPVGDTLLHADTDYFYWRHLDWFYQRDHPAEDTNWWTLKREHPMSWFTFDGIGNHISGNQLYSEHPIKVVGIALCAYMDELRDTTIRYYRNTWNAHIHGDHSYDSLYFPNTNDTSMKDRITDSAILYKIAPADGGYAVNKLAAAPWRMEQPHRHIKIPPLDTIYAHTCSPGCEMADLYDAMFDSAVVLDGSFLVASTAYNNETSWYPRTI
jgi:hypothetical protein